MADRSAPAPVVVWFRDDLRLHDHPALADAVRRGGPVIPVYVFEPGGDDGRASCWWRHRSLAALSGALAQRGSRLVFARGPAEEVVPRLARQAGAATVVWNRRWSPDGRAADGRTAAALAAAGIAHGDHHADLLAEPDALATAAGGPYRVFTPFWRKLQRTVPATPLPAPAALPVPAVWPPADGPADPDPSAVPPDGSDPGAHWRPGEEGAAILWGGFRRDALASYDRERDRAARPGTSRLSPHLRHGEISVRELWHGAAGPDGEAWRRQLAWRDFAHHLQHHFPATATEPFDPAFAEFPWTPSPRFLAAWQAGRTGYPFVDAGMRQLAATGWMHNRLRMVVASFLVKHLLVPWQDGAAWFMEMLVDADPAANTFGWQWTAGCGADAAPWFRIFNPVVQGKRHDPEGAYIRRWVPELAGLPRRWVHAPWLATPETGLDPGHDYPAPLVDHEEARARAMVAWQEIRRR